MYDLFRAISASRSSISASQRIEACHRISSSKSFLTFFDAFKRQKEYSSIKFHSQEEKEVAEYVAQRRLPNLVRKVCFKVIVERLKWIVGISVRSIKSIFLNHQVSCVDIVFFTPDEIMEKFYQPIVRQLNCRSRFLYLIDREQLVPISVLGLIKLPLGQFKVEIYKRYFRGLLCRLSPRVVVFPELGGMYQAAALVEICNELGIDSVCVQYGWMGPRYFNVDVGCSSFLSWGDAINDQIQPNIVDLECISVGSPVLKQYQKVNSNQAEVFKIYTSAYGSFYNQWTKHHIQLVLDLRKNFPSANICYRPHPSETIPLDKREWLASHNIFIEDAKETSLDKSFSESTVVISNLSTILYESVVSGLATICYNPTVTAFQKDFDQFFGEGVVKEARSIDELVTLLKCKETYELPSIDRSLLCYAYGEDAVNNIVSYLRKLVESYN